ncbi:MAG: B-box zinc finger protein [Dehalococcoidales bacterium]|nr:B-box zinc finger protein [Dehalococcoidales bacterium]
MTEPETMKCATHPDIETVLRCGKCGKPICPRCMVQTPVGARCRECAKLYKLPTYRVSGAYYLRAAGAALGMAIVIGVVWGIIDSFLISFFFGFFSLILAAGAGYAIGEVVSRSVNKKRSPWLAVIGSLAVVIAYLVNIFTFGSVSLSPLWIIFDLVGIGIGIYMAVNRLR